ncbi:uncharacterized protein LOC121513545 [Cheilinus undulatus]|uniref:uncharacterized protein LOC121513545 n=1 Tax=Cheilinus undulatus TaxID=241271 RepID=UPI001BD36562|nr:uncharacterized protein LOC121513545 [Cheilinus undulatus]
MQRGKQRLQNILEDGLGKDLMNARRFCFSCEQIFADRRCLEEHVCPAASHICSCGTEFTEYKDMLEHSTTHEPGHQVLDHETIKKRRIEKRIAEEAQLKRLETGEVVWKAPHMGSVPSLSLPVKPVLQAPITTALMPQLPMQSGLISQVPELYPSMSQASLLQNPMSSTTTDMKNIFAGVGAPTVDLWTIYQPVVLLQTVRQFNKKKPYSCSKCGQCFATKTSLIAHHSCHVVDKVSGCIGCGLLLSSKKIVPRFHICNAPSNTTKFKLITAKPPGFKILNKTGPVRSQNLSAQVPELASFLKSQNPRVGNNGSQAAFGSSTLQLKNMNIKTYNRSNQMSPSLLLKTQNPNPQKPFMPFPSKSYNQNPGAPVRAGRGRPPTLTGQMKKPKTVAAILASKTQSSSRPTAFTCRICLIPFETAQMLQRHKCIKAQEFIAMRGPKTQYKVKRVTPVAGQQLAQMNGARKLGVPASGNVKTHQVVTIDLEKEQGIPPLNGESDVETDDDCYIVEKGPDKPAEVIYQVTSSVPIKT